jgi:hypothetical protein
LLRRLRVVYKKQLGVALPNVTERLSANRIL